MKYSLERRILIFSLLALTLTITVNTGFNVASFHNDYREGILRRCATLATGFKKQIENVLNLGLPLEEIDGLDQRCEAIVQQDHEISYCLVENSQGRLLYHSVEPFPKNSEVNFLSQFSDDVSILSTPSLGTVYDYAVPIYNYDDTLAGRVRIGFQKEILNDLTVDHLASSMLILLAAFILVFAIIILFARYHLVSPIKRLCDVATEVAAGKFDVDAPDVKTSELVTLGDTLTEMARSLQERDQQIKQHYQDLDVTNTQLQLSYEHLERLSSELGRSREMYRMLLDDASDAILVCSDEDNILMVNKAAEKFFGQPRERLEGRNYFSFLEMIRCTDLEQQFETYQDVKPGVSSESEIRFTRAKDQRQLIGSATSCAIVDKNGRRLVQTIVRDATHEEEIRLNLERTASEMARLNQMKNSFLGLASHELKTPLTIIMGYVELLMTEMNDRLDDGTREMISHIARASDRLSEIIRDMVDVSLLDGKTIDLVSKPVEVNTLVHHALDKVQTYIGQRKQSLVEDLAEDLPLVRCDLDRMAQALGNLLGNAIKFTPDGGRIEVMTRLVERSRLPERFGQNGHEGACLLSGENFPYVEIAIRDTGIGIAEEDQEAIFEKFYEAGDVEEHSSGKVAFKSRGTGLGLTITKGVIALHGGAVWAESPGHDPESLPGSTFHVLLPVSGEFVN